MKKIINYVANAQGLAIKFLLLFSFVASIISATMLYIGGEEFIPYAQSVADQMLPIKIENGKVVEPVDTVKRARLDIDGYNLDLPIYLDTTVDTIDTSSLNDGIYMTRSAIYSVNRNQTRITKLEGNIDLPQDDYTDFFASVLKWVAIFIAVFGSVFFFIYLFILGIFYTVCTYPLTAVMKKNFEFDLRMRSSVISLIFTSAVFYLINLIGISTGKLSFFLIVMILEFLLLKDIPSENKENENKAEEKTEDKTQE